MSDVVPVAFAIFPCVAFLLSQLMAQKVIIGT